MRLYKMELYKLLHRKLFSVGEVCMTGILLLFFHIKVSGESAIADGIAYHGYEAVQVNRRIAGAVSEYGNSWLTFKDFWDIGMILGSIIVLFTVSIVFASESQTKMLPLLFTAKDGRKKDIYAKTAAAFTVSIGIWLEVILLDFALCGVVYGFGSLDCLCGETTMTGSIRRWSDMLPVKTFLILAMLCSLSGMLLLCAIILWISAYFKSPFHTIVAAALCWVFPIFVNSLFISAGLWNRMYGSGIVLALIGSLINVLIYISPLPLVECNVEKSWAVLTGIALTAAVLCTVLASRKYRRQQT